MVLLAAPPMSAPTCSPKPSSSHLWKLPLCFGNEPFPVGLLPRGSQTGQGRELNRSGLTSYFKSIIWSSNDDQIKKQKDHLILFFIQLLKLCGAEIVVAVV